MEPVTIPLKTTLERVIESVVAQTGMSAADASRLTPETNINNNPDLQIDSLDSLEILMDLEESFDINVSDSEAEAVTTVQSAVDLIDRKLAER